MRAWEKRGAEAGACRTWRGRPGTLGRGEGSNGGEARRCTSVQRAVLRMVQVIGGERGQCFGCPGLVAVVVGVCVCALF